MITPRTTRLVRVRDLHAFRRALVSLASDGDPLDARDRLVVVPTRAAGALLAAAIEGSRLEASDVVVLPEFSTARELPQRLARRAVPSLVPSDAESREILMGVACREAVAAGYPPPFALRPGLVAAALEFHDELARRRQETGSFERLTLGRLEAGADYDKGAERLVRQTRFLVAAFRRYEALCADRDVVDDRRLRAAALASPAAHPWRHVIVAVGDESRDRYGLSAADWDVLTRIAGLARLDLVATDAEVAGAWHEQVHELLPGIDEVRMDGAERPSNVLRVPVPAADGGRGEDPPAGGRLWVARDREEEVRDFARWVRELRRREPGLALEGVALVVRHPLPYAYLAREVLRSANVPCQVFDALPLAGEPYAALLEQVFAFVRTRGARGVAVALLRTPYLEWRGAEHAMTAESVAAADALLSEQGYLGGDRALKQVLAQAGSAAASPRDRLAVPALEAILAAAQALGPLEASAPAALHLDCVLEFLTTRARADVGHESVRERRGRAAVRGILVALRDGYRALDSEPVTAETTFAVVRRRIEAHTFAPRVGDRGVLVVDAESARFGAFTCVQIAGLVEGEWPARPPGNVFYTAPVLRDLGWSGDAGRVARERSAFADLLGLPSASLTASAFALEDDAPVTPSPFTDVLAGREAQMLTSGRAVERVFEDEALGCDPVVLEGFIPDVRRAAEWRLGRARNESGVHGGLTSGWPEAPVSVSSLERYQDCPFRYFAADVLRLTETPVDEPFLSPRARGRFIHEVFERFFSVWDRQGARSITTASMREAREVFEEVADPMLARLGESDAALERARLFGSAISIGMVDHVLEFEASSEARVVERWLETPFTGTFALGGDRPVQLRGVADRVDLLDGHAIRVVDYKTGSVPRPARTLQVAVYALCAQERLEQRDSRRWSVAEAAYIAFSGRQPITPVVARGDDSRPVLSGVRERVLSLVDGISGGEFPVRPHDPLLCRSCAYPAVCRKEGLDGE